MAVKEKTLADLLAYFATKSTIDPAAITRFLAGMEQIQATGPELASVLEDAKYRIECSRCKPGLPPKHIRDRYLGVNRRPL